MQGRPKIMELFRITLSTKNKSAILSGNKRPPVSQCHFLLTPR